MLISKHIQGLSLAYLLQHSDLDFRIRAFLLKRALIFQALLVKRDEAKVVIFVHAIKEIFDVLHGLIAEND